MKLIKWKKRTSSGINVWEGTVKNDTEPLITIQGHLCVTDIRHCRKSKEWVSPNHYKITDISIDEAKQLAHDLVTGENFEKHENNRLSWLAEQDRTTKLLQEADEFIRNLEK